MFRFGLHAFNETPFNQFSSYKEIKLGRIPDSEKARTYHHKHRNLNLSNLNQDNLKIELRNRLLTKMNTGIVSKDFKKKAN